MKRVKQLSTANQKDFFTIEEAAQILSIKPGVVRNYLWEGKLTTYKFKTLTLLKSEEVATWKSKGRQR